MEALEENKPKVAESTKTPIKSEFNKDNKIIKSIFKFFHYVGITILLVFIIVIASLAFASSVSSPVYIPNYEITIKRDVNPITYACDSYRIRGNKYHLYDTNKVETNMLIIPIDLIVDIKTLNKDGLRK